MCAEVEVGSQSLTASTAGVAGVASQCEKRREIVVALKTRRLAGSGVA